MRVRPDGTYSIRVQRNGMAMIFRTFWRGYALCYHVRYYRGPFLVHRRMTVDLDGYYGQ